MCLNSELQNFIVFFRATPKCQFKQIGSCKTNALIIAELAGSGDMGGFKFHRWLLLKIIHVLYPYRNKQTDETCLLNDKYSTILHPTLPMIFFGSWFLLGDHGIGSDDPQSSLHSTEGKKFYSILYYIFVCINVVYISYCNEIWYDLINYLNLIPLILLSFQQKFSRYIYIKFNFKIRLNLFLNFTLKWLLTSDIFGNIIFGFRYLNF